MGSIYAKYEEIQMYVVLFYKHFYKLIIPIYAIHANNDSLFVKILVKFVILNILSPKNNCASSSVVVFRLNRLKQM